MKSFCFVLVLAQIEDRLLQDMDFALKTGFTVEEILTDLQAKGKNKLLKA